MAEKSILFLSTNVSWGGSEILWAHSARAFYKKGFRIKAGAAYDFVELKKIINDPDNLFDLRNRFVYPGLVIKAIHKLILGKYKPRDMLRELIKNEKPALVVISQGNNVIGSAFMELCNELSVPFVTITQLVPESLWPTLDENKINNLRELYTSSKRNYFVSGQNLFLHEKIMGQRFSNAAIIYNPFIATPANSEIEFPSLENNYYKIALVGRAELFHKGYDLLLDVVRQEKWKQRNVRFNIFGNGPHLQVLKRLISQYETANVVVKEHVKDVVAIWKEHHILMMPSRMEGQSLALIEAMHYKRAAIATRVGGVDELVEDGQTGFVADAATVTSIDEALERAWNRRAEWEQMGINAGKHIAKVHPPNAMEYFAKQLLELME